MTPYHDIADAPRRPAILLVEDEETLMRALRAVLRRSGFRVITASSGTRALELIERRGDEIQLVLSDIMLPGAPGTDVVRTFLEQFPERPALLMTGYAPQASALSGLDGVRVLNKPVPPAELIRLIKEQLA